MRLRELMEERGLAGYQVAEALHVDPSAVSKWVSGQVMPRADKLPALADLLHCSIDALYGRVSPGSGPAQDMDGERSA